MQIIIDNKENASILKTKAVSGSTPCVLNCFLLNLRS